MMRFDIVTLFPEMPLLIEKFGITARASKLGLWQLKCWNPRDFVFDAHKTVDDRPFGGGPGMVGLQNIHRIKLDHKTDEIYCWK